MLKIYFILCALLIAGARQKFACGIEVGENHHNLKEKQPHTREQHAHYTHKSQSDRCTIICPVVFVLPVNYSGNFPSVNNVPAPSTTSSKITTHKSSAASSTTISYGNVKNSLQNENSVVKQKGANPITTLITQLKKDQKLINRLGKKNKGVRKYMYHARQKQLLLKQVNLGNTHGKKAYEFREFSTSLCRVICTEDSNSKNGINRNTPTPQQHTTESDEDSEEDSFVEGEDEPIEATIKPVSQSIVIEGIRPFGTVNFNNMDDFGPNGESARNIPKTDDRDNKLMHYRLHNKIIKLPTKCET